MHLRFSGNFVMKATKVLDLYNLHFLDAHFHLNNDHTISDLFAVFRMVSQKRSYCSCFHLWFPVISSCSFRSDLGVG